LAYPFTLSPTTVGHPNNEDYPFFIGGAGGVPTFFYEQPANRVNYRSVDVP
jgi:hypothetical protein